MSEIKNRSNWFPQPVTQRPFQVGLPTTEPCVWWADRLLYSGSAQHLYDNSPVCPGAHSVDQAGLSKMASG